MESTEAGFSSVARKNPQARSHQEKLNTRKSFKQPKKLGFQTSIPKELLK